MISCAMKRISNRRYLYITAFQPMRKHHSNLSAMAAWMKRNARFSWSDFKKEKPALPLSPLSKGPKSSTRSQMRTKTLRRISRVASLQQALRATPTRILMINSNTWCQGLSCLTMRKAGMMMVPKSLTLLRACTKKTGVQEPWWLRRTSKSLKWNKVF